MATRAGSGGLGLLTANPLANRSVGRILSGHRFGATV